MTPVLHHDRVDEHGHAWVDAGLITDDQLAAIRHFEHLDDASTDTDARGGRRFSVAAEIAVYLGSVLAVTGGGGSSSPPAGTTWRSLPGWPSRSPSWPSACAQAHGRTARGSPEPLASEVS